MLPAAFTLLSLAALVTAWRIAGFESLSSPGAIPLAAAAAMLLGAGGALLAHLRRPGGGAAGPGAGAAAGTDAAADGDGPAAPPSRGPLAGARIAGVLALVALFAVLLEPAGFLPAAGLFLLLAFLILDPRRPGRAVAVALLALAAVFAVFRLVFEVVLPEGIVPERAIIAAVEDVLARLSGGPR